MAMTSISGNDGPTEEACGLALKSVLLALPLGYNLCFHFLIVYSVLLVSTLRL
jgi:hypothetical protein